MKVIIFGGNCYGEKVNYLLDDERYEVVAYADNNERQWGGGRYGVPIIAPQDIKKLEYDYIIIAYATYEAEIKRQLIYDLGVDENKVFVFLPETEDIKLQDSRIEMLKNCLKLLKERNVQGNVAELGVYKGEFAKLLNKYLPDRKLYLFDTFEGFDLNKDQTNAPKNADEYKSWFKDTSEEVVLRKMRYPENCIIKKGYFPETAEDVEDSFCFVSLDADIYMPTLNGLKYFYPRLNKGGYIFVHDFDNQEWPVCRQAVMDFCEEYGVSFVPILDRCGTAIITK